MRLNEKESLDLHSGDYVQTIENLPAGRMSRLLPLMELGPQCRLVDFACGTGLLSELAHDSIKSYDGVDFSPDFVAAASKRAARLGISNATFHCEDIVSFCQRHFEEYDVVTANDFSEHVYDEDFLRIFQGEHRILKPGGRLYIYTPNREFFYEWMKDVGLAKQFPQHVAVRNAGQYVELLQACGFPRANIEVSFLPHFNILRVVQPLSHLPLIGKWFRAKLFLRCCK